MTSLYMPNELWRSKSDGPTLTAAAAASCLQGVDKYTLPAGYFDRSGKGLKIRATGRISSVITTPGTARFDLRLGGTVVWDGLAILLDTVAAHTNAGWILDLDLTCRSIGSGAGGTLIGQGTWTCEDILGVPATAPKGVLSAVLPWNSAPAVGSGFDTSAQNVVDLFFTQTVATGSLTVHQFILTEPN
jgi:hypothetical protein